MNGKCCSCSFWYGWCTISIQFNLVFSVSKEAFINQFRIQFKTPQMKEKVPFLVVLWKGKGSGQGSIRRRIMNWIITHSLVSSRPLTLSLSQTRVVRRHRYFWRESLIRKRKSEQHASASFPKKHKKVHCVKKFLRGKKCYPETIERGGKACVPDTQNMHVSKLFSISTIFSCLLVWLRRGRRHKLPLLPYKPGC